MEKEKIQNLIKLIEFTNEFNKVKRTVYIKRTDEFESDSEHSYQLALTAWYLNEIEGLDLDLNLIFKYSLVHDLVEVYAGDTYAHNNSQKDADEKHHREQEALKRIEKEFSEFPEMTDLIKQYELKKDEESKFVYALDKILPTINLLIDNGRAWKERNVTMKMIREIKDEKVKINPTIEKYWIEIRSIIEKRQGELLNAKS